ncbi:hypothetical protein MKW98_027984 [Papaver atlanticum]|uniref:Uncharacterized protein n=1 Tax=Papaver atlanticum TaxID=357466 RepID=A0AAD4T4U9_9MAGN|nr:hypothetical protein MKW98_027984 [Papaver atlanticum]
MITAFCEEPSYGNNLFEKEAFLFGQTNPLYSYIDAYGVTCFDISEMKRFKGTALFSMSKPSCSGCFVWFKHVFHFYYSSKVYYYHNFPVLYLLPS